METDSVDEEIAVAEQQLLQLWLEASPMAMEAHFP